MAALESTTVKKSTKKTRRVTPAKSRTPVIAGRVPASLHAQLKQAAAESGRSLSDELAWRAGLSFEWERAFEDTRKLLADAKRANKANLRQAMRDDGLELIHGAAGDYWKEPGMPPLKSVLDPEMKAAITDIIRQELARTEDDPK